jgi:hypothetical protein
MVQYGKKTPLVTEENNGNVGQTKDLGKKAKNLIVFGQMEGCVNENTIII